MKLLFLTRTFWLTAVLPFVLSVLNEVLAKFPELANPEPGFQWTSVHTSALIWALWNTLWRRLTSTPAQILPPGLGVLVLLFAFSPAPAQVLDRVSAGFAVKADASIVPVIGYRALGGRIPETWKTHWLMPDEVSVDTLMGWQDKLQVGWQAAAIWDLTDTDVQFYAGVAWLETDLRPIQIRELWERAGLTFGLRLRL